MISDRANVKQVVSETLQNVCFALFYCANIVKQLVLETPEIICYEMLCDGA